MPLLMRSSSSGLPCCEDHSGLRQLPSPILKCSLRRRLQSGIGVIAFLVDAVDDEAGRFCEAYGFRSIPGMSCVLLPMMTIEVLARGKTCSPPP